MRCVLLPRGVFRGTAIRDFEAESVSDVNLSTDKEDQLSAHLAFFRPVALTVEAELTLHLLESGILPRKVL